jgi:flavin reductase (DIM6/NTAB) family NADH-FMN oxidoreductase RutF
VTDTAWLLDHLWGPIVAVTAEHDGRANGLISSTAITASLLPERPRLSVQLSRANLTHDIVLEAGTLAVHVLPNDETGLEIVRSLGFHSGREGTKLAAFPTRRGVTGAPLLTDAVAYVEARTVSTLTTGAITVIVADVVAGERLREAPLLTIEEVRSRAPSAWLAEWEARLSEELAAARRLEHSHRNG